MKNRKGFSLFELLVTISIIGILMAVAVVSYSSAQKKARDNRRVQDMNAVQKAMEQVYAGSSTYSYPITTNVADGSWLVNGQKVLEVFPRDPKDNTEYYYNFGPSDGSYYCFCDQLESASGNSGNNCTFGTATTHYCVKNQQ